MTSLFSGPVDSISCLGEGSVCRHAAEMPEVLCSADCHHHIAPSLYYLSHDISPEADSPSEIKTDLSIPCPSVPRLCGDPIGMHPVSTPNEMMDDAAAASTADSRGREQKVAHKFNAEGEEEGEVQKASGPEKYAWKFSSGVMSHSIRREG